MVEAAIAGQGEKASSDGYVLDEQVGYLLRQAMQRHLAIFSESMTSELTSTQFSVLFRLLECGPCSQNLLGRRAAMDAATVKGVIDRLTLRGLTESRSDADDGRLAVVSLTAQGRNLIETAIPRAERISAETLKPLSPREQATFLKLLRKVC
jgi:MarR family transcriptional regulator, lower aerobic nicotinate degradation pathway regulator